MVMQIGSPRDTSIIKRLSSLAYDERKKLTKARCLAQSILAGHGIEIAISACGECDTPWIAMRYKGEYIIGNEKQMQGAEALCTFKNDGQPWMKALGG